MLSLASSALAFNAAPLRVQPTARASVSMAVEDLVGGINDPIFGGTPEGKIFDPLGLGADEASLYRRRVVEIKHGRICMMAFLGMTVGPNELIAPSSAYISITENVRFSDIPGGIAAIDAVPSAGWAQIIAVVGIHELTVNKQDYTKVPGEIPTFLGFKPEDPEEFKSKQLKELKNGRLAMIAVLGELSKPPAAKPPAASHAPPPLQLPRRDDAAAPTREMPSQREMLFQRTRAALDAACSVVAAVAAQNAKHSSTRLLPPLPRFLTRSRLCLSRSRFAVAQQVSGMGTYEQLNAIVADLPLPF